MKRKQRFSIRKSTLGVASVLLGVFAVGAATVGAATIIPVLNGVAQPAVDVADDQLENEAMRLIAEYRAQNYKLTERTSVDAPAGVLTLDFVTVAADDADYRIIVKIDGEVVSDITHVVNAERAEELALEALEVFSEDNKYSLVGQTVTDVTSEGATLTLELETTKRSYKVIDKDGNEQAADFPAMTDTAWGDVLASVVEANTSADQVFDADASYFDEDNQVDVLVFKANTEDFVIKLVIDGNEQISNYSGITHAQFLEILASVSETHKELVAGEVNYNGNTVTLNFTTPVVEEAKEDFTVVVVIDGVASTTEYKGVTHAQFLEALSALTEANKDLVAGEVVYNGNTVTLNFTTKAVEEVKEDFTIVVVVDGVASTTEYKGVTHAQFLEALSALTEANKDLVAGEVNYNGNTVTLNFTTPVVEEAKEDFTIVVVVDGVASTHEYKGVTHAQFLEALSALTEANKDLVAGEVNYNGNTVTLNFTTPAVVEAKEDFTIVVVVDGVASTHEFTGITHSEFLQHLSAQTEAQLAAGLQQGGVIYQGNKVTLKFTSPTERKDAWVGDDFAGDKDNDAKEIVSVDTVVEEKAKEAEGSKLPETGSAGFVAQVVLGASALLGSLGVALKKKR